MGITEQEFDDAMEMLERDGLIERTGEKDGDTLWRPTEKGLAVGRVLDMQMSHRSN